MKLWIIELAGVPQVVTFSGARRPWTEPIAESMSDAPNLDGATIFSREDAALMAIDDMKPEWKPADRITLGAYKARSAIYKARPRYVTREIEV